MPKKFHKTKPIVSLSDFLQKATLVKNFASSSGKKYQVTKIENCEMFFKRLDANAEYEWQMNMQKVHQAYIELDDFVTKNFKPYVPITHSPARGLLLHLGLLE